jgi:cytochrome P450
MLISLAPGMAVTKGWENRNQRLLRDIIDNYDPMLSNPGHATIFHELLASELPAEEKSFGRLWQEGAALLGAGVETTSNTLNVAIYHLLQHPTKLSLLKAELEQCMPISQELALWLELEKLPYLGAVIKEALRLALGSTSRFIRVAPESTLRYKDYVFPPGTAVSMSSMLLGEHPDLFSDPTSFMPERWLAKNTSTDLYSFGRGPRMCAGMK